MWFFIVSLLLCLLQISLFAVLPELKFNLPIAASGAAVCFGLETGLICAGSFLLFGILMSYNSYIAWFNLAFVILINRFYPEQISNKILVAILIINTISFIDLFFIRSCSNAGQVITEFVNNNISGIIIWKIFELIQNSNKNAKHKRF